MNFMEKSLIYLRRAHEFARDVSLCDKVVVGSIIITADDLIIYGANRVLPGTCKGVADCQVDGHCVSTIHSEIDAIVRAKRDLTGATIFVTRYPCENCARAIITAGISRVVYGRKLRVSYPVFCMFLEAGVELIHIHEFDEEDYIDRNR